MITQEIPNNLLYQIRNISYKQCEIHPEELCYYVCLEDDFKNQKTFLVCPLCIEENLKSSKTIHIKKLLIDLYLNFEETKQQNQLVDNLIPYIQQQREKTIQEMRANLQYILNIHEEQIQQTQQIYDRLEQEIYNLSQFEKNVQQIFDYIDQDDVDDFYNNLQKILRITSFEQQNLTIDQKKITENINNVIKSLNNQNTQSFLRQQDIIISQRDNLISQKQFNLIQKKSLFKFSVSLKHPLVKIIDDVTVESSSDTGYRFALLEPSLSGNNNQDFAFHILKQNKSKWLGVGICQKNKIVKNDFGFSFSKTGHGAYLISSNGGSWSTSDSTFNNVVKSFKFQQDDIVYCSYLPKENKIVFKKKGGYSYVLEIQPSIEYNPCVLFYYTQDQVKFINNKKL